VGLKVEEVLVVGGAAAVAYFLNIFGFKNIIDNMLRMPGPSPGQGPTVLFSDTFNDTLANYTLTDGQVSPNGNWRCVYTGYGSVGTRTASDGKKSFYLYPKTSTTTYAETHASLAVTTRTFKDCEITFKMRTMRQLRQGLTPQNWETGWFMFRYTDETHHYYIAHKMHGVELGKKDNAVGNTNLEDQIILATPSFPDLVLGQWYDWKINLQGYHIQAWINNTKVIDYTDNDVHNPVMASGLVGPYTEDSEIEIRDVRITMPF